MSCQTRCSAGIFLTLSSIARAFSMIRSKCRFLNFPLLLLKKALFSSSLSFFQTPVILRSVNGLYRENEPFGLEQQQQSDGDQHKATDCVSVPNVSSGQPGHPQGLHGDEKHEEVVQHEHEDV